MCAAQKTSVVTTTTTKKFHSLYRNAGAPATSVAMTMIVPYTVPAIVSDEPASSSRKALEDGLTTRKPAVAIARRLRAGHAQVREVCVLGRLRRARPVLLRDLVRDVLAVRAVGLVLARAHREHDAGPFTGSHDHVLGLWRAVHEVPLAQWPLLVLDDQERLAREHEERLGLGLP